MVQKSFEMSWPEPRPEPWGVEYAKGPKRMRMPGAE